MTLVSVTFFDIFGHMCVLGCNISWICYIEVDVRRGESHQPLEPLLVSFAPGGGFLNTAAWWAVTTPWLEQLFLL